MRMPTLAASLLLALTLSPAAQADRLSRFDSGDEGWTVVSGASGTWRASGGNDGGYLEAADTTFEDFDYRAPASWLGDWSAYLGGRFSFDARNINGVPADWNPFGTLTLSNGTQSVSLDFVADGNPAPGAGWQSFSVLLSTANFGASLPTVLANVTELRLRGEFRNGIEEVVGIDNLRVTAVPEPASAALLCSGLGGLGWLATRRRRLSRGS